MQVILDTIIGTFSQIKEAGSYFLFYLLALGLGFIIAWDRYGNSTHEDNWMVEEAKNGISLWPFLYGVYALVLVVANPLAIWIFNRITPIEGHYHKLWPFLLLLFLIAYGVVCFTGLLSEQRQKNIVVIGFIILIGLAGSSYGLLSECQTQELYSRERQVVDWVEKLQVGLEIQGEDTGVLLAPDKILEYIRMYQPELKLLYGKDLYTPGLDLGIMDSYSPELMGIYEAMKNPRENLTLLAEMAAKYDCKIMVVDYFEGAPEMVGEYRLRDVYEEEKEGYLIYRKEFREDLNDKRVGYE